MVNQLKKIYDKLFKSTEQIEHEKKVEIDKRADTKTNETSPNIKTKKHKKQTK